MDNLELYESFREVPDSAKKTIKGGRMSGMTDINPVWRIKKLTEAFGPCGVGWYYKVIKQWTETVGNEVAVFVDIELYINYKDNWSMPIHGTGGSRLATVEKSGVYVSDECYKMATTDALSVACKNLGIGADVYFNKDVTKYTDEQQPALVGKKEIELIKKEMDRTGITEASILKTFGRKSLVEMTVEDYGICMQKFKNTQTLPPPCPDVPNDPDVPEKLPFA